MFEILKSILPSRQFHFIAFQISAAGWNKRGVRYTDEFKALALSFYHTSPKCYYMLQQIFTLPSKRTLQKIMQDIDIRPGFNEAILQAVADKVQTMPEQHKLCAIIFDEMSIKEKLTYDRRTDSVEGVMDHGSFGRGNMMANHAGVFMVRGLVKKWKQPIGYIMNNGPLKNHDLKTLTMECIDKVSEAGLIPKVLICDQGSNNTSMVASLGVTVTKPYFEHDHKRMYVMYDPPHLVKNIRNNLQKSGFLHNGVPIKWDYIKQLHDYQASRNIKLAPKLTWKHVDLPAFSKMKVSLATQVLSHSVASAIATMVDTGQFPQEAMDTAIFLERFDCLFNVFNSQRINNANKFKRALREGSGHLSFLEETFDWLGYLESGSGRVLNCVEGWKLSIRSLMLLWEELRTQHEVKFLLTNRCNQDCIENFFSIIRGKGGHRYNPDAVQFRAAYRAATVDSMFSFSKGSNCVLDLDSHLLKLSNLTSHTPPPADDLPEVPQQVYDIINVAQPSEFDLTDQNIIVYIAGYMARRVFEKHGECDPCRSLLVTNYQSESEAHIFINRKQYEHLDQGGLYYPTSALVDSVSTMEASFRLCAKGLIRSEKLHGRMYNHIAARVENDILTCGDKACEQRKKYLINLFITVRLHHRLREINRKADVPNQKRNRKAVILQHH